MAVLQEEPMFLYRLGVTPPKTQAGVKWQLEQHPSLRLYPSSVSLRNQQVIKSRVIHWENKIEID